MINVMKMEYFFSILIPGWNAEQYIENCVNSILENDYMKYKIILIVGGTDRSYDIALELQKNYSDKIIALEQKTPHKNKALNSSLKYINGELIILTDIDCIYQKNWLRKINEIFQNKKYNIITSSYLPYQNRKSSLAEFNNIKHWYNLLKFKSGEIIIGNKLCGGNSAFRKEIFLDKIGKFEEISQTGDDKILGMQFNEQGEKLYFFQDIYVYTECYSNSLKKFIKRRIRWARDLFITLKRKDIFKLLISFIISLFKLFYPLLAITIALIFFDVSFILLFLLPWIIFYLMYLINFYFYLKRMSIDINSKLNSNLNYKKAFKIIPLLFFAFGIVTFISLMYPKRHKWYL